MLVRCIALQTRRVFGFPATGPPARACAAARAQRGASLPGGDWRADGAVSGGDGAEEGDSSCVAGRSWPGSCCAAALALPVFPSAVTAAPSLLLDTQTTHRACPVLQSSPSQVQQHPTSPVCLPDPHFPQSPRSSPCRLGQYDVTGTILDDYPLPFDALEEPAAPDAGGGQRGKTPAKAPARGGRRGKAAAQDSDSSEAESDGGPQMPDSSDGEEEGGVSTGPGGGRAAVGWRISSFLLAALRAVHGAPWCSSA